MGGCRPGMPILATAGSPTIEVSRLANARSCFLGSNKGAPPATSPGLRSRRSIRMSGRSGRRIWSSRCRFPIPSRPKAPCPSTVFAWRLISPRMSTSRPSRPSPGIGPSFTTSRSSSRRPEPSDRKPIRDSLLAAYTPGDRPSVFPPGVGKKISRGSDLLFEVHYQPIGKPRFDRSSIGLVFSPEPPRHLAITKGIPAHNLQFRPATRIAS